MCWLARELEITRLDARNGVLSVTFSQGVASFDLGKDAGKWAAQIKNPPSLLDKLGVKPGAKVAVLSIGDKDFLSALRERVPMLAESKAGAELDMLFYGVEQTKALENLAALRKAIKPSGAIWVISPKGKGTAVPEGDVRASAQAAGLVDVKVAAFSPTHTAAKLVIPVAKR